MQTHAADISDRTSLLFVGALVIGAPLLFFGLYQLALQRFIAFDEGFYLMAGKAVTEGKLPYLDFFYPQMPLLPFFHAIWISLLGASWEMARAVTVCFSVGTLLTLGFYTWHARTASLALLAIAAVITQTLFLTWFTVAKTYAFASLPLLGATVCALMTFRKVSALPPHLLLAFSGFLLGLACDVRLFYVVLIPIFVLFILVKTEHRARNICAFLLGGLLTFLPHFYFIITDVDSYWFNNVGYHMVRSHRSPDVDIRSKFNVLQIVTGLKHTARIDGYGFPLLFWFSAITVAISILRRRLPPFATTLGLVLFGCYFLPDPVHVQYFSTCIPLLVLGLVEATKSQKIPTLLLLSLIVLSLWSLPTGLERMTKTGEGLKGIDRFTRKLFTIPKMKEVSEKIDEHFLPGDTVMSQWPGFLFETELRPASGLENQFWIRTDGKLSEDEIDRYHLMSTDRLKLLPQREEIAGVVIEKRKFKRYTSGSVLREERFQEVAMISGVQIFKREAS